MTNKYRKNIKLITFIGLLFVLLQCASAFAYDPEQVVATVGDFKIKRVYLEEVLDKYIPPGGFHASVEEKQREKYMKDALQQIIDVELLYHAAQKKGISIDDKTIEQVVKKNKERFGNEKDFLHALKRLGLTLDGFKLRVKKYAMVKKLLSELARESLPTDDEIKAFYEKNKKKFKRPEAIHLYSIFINVPKKATDKQWKEKRELAESILKKLKEGADFSDIAYKYSDDEYSMTGGDLGIVHRGRLQPKELEDVAFSLKVGKISNIIKTPYGFHILKVVEKIPAKQLTLQDVKKDIVREIQKKRFNEKKDALLKEMRKLYPVRILIKLPETKEEKKKQKKHP